MADNVTLNAGAGGDDIAADQIPITTGPKFQRIKLIHGIDGTNDGDVASTNPLPVQIGDGTDAALVDGSGNLNVVEASAAAIKTAVEIIDDAVAAEAAALGSGVLIQGDDGTDRKNINVDATTGDLQVDITHTVTVDGSGVTQPVSGTVTETNSAAIKTAVELIDNAISGTEMQVDVVAPLPAGTNAIGKLAANDGVDIGDVTINNASLTVDLGANNDVVVAGDVAHDAADSGNPTKIGAKAVNHGATPTAVGSGDRTDLYANRSGVQFVIGGHPNTETLHGHYTAAQTNTVLKTVNANERFVITAISCICDNANTVDVNAQVEFTTTTIWRHPGIPAGGGATWGDGSGILAIGAAAADVEFTCEVPTSGGIAVSVTGYLITEA
jgi:hypothetical protein